MICAHSTLACPFCRRRLSIWLRYNPDYSKLIIKRDSTSDIEQKVIAKRSHRASKSRPAGVLHQDWLLARQIHYDQLEEVRGDHLPSSVCPSFISSFDIPTAQSLDRWPRRFPTSCCIDPSFLSLYDRIDLIYSFRYQQLYNSLNKA